MVPCWPTCSHSMSMSSYILYGYNMHTALSRGHWIVARIRHQRWSGFSLRSSRPRVPRAKMWKRRCWSMRCVSMCVWEKAMAREKEYARTPEWKLEYGEAFYVATNGPVCSIRIDTYTRTCTLTIHTLAHYIRQVQQDTRWDEEKNVSKIKNWRDDTHTTHRNSHSAYSHYAQVVRVKLADSPRCPARDVLNTNVSNGNVKAITG